MFFEAFKTTGLAIIQILCLAVVGYALHKKKLISETGFDAISRLVIEVTLPALIFYQLIRDFSFSLYPRWWLFPLLSITITLFGLALGFLFGKSKRGLEYRLQFTSLIAFQNSGYLPLAIIGTLLPSQKAATLLVYLFLFLAGFNIVMWPLAMYLFTFSKNARFALSHLFNMPTLAALLGLGIVFLGLNAFIPPVAVKTLRMVGDCTIPLALMVVGADLARIKLTHVDGRAMALLSFVKLILMPLAGLALVKFFHLPELLGLLLIMQLAAPSATSLSAILRHCKKEDLFVSQGIFFTHVISIATLPIFLSVYSIMSAAR